MPYIKEQPLIFPKRVELIKKIARRIIEEVEKDKHRDSVTLSDKTYDLIKAQKWGLIKDGLGIFGIRRDSVGRLYYKNIHLVSK